MPRFAADLTLMFRELPLHERLAAVADAGFRGVQLPLPYDQDLAQLRHGLNRHHLEMVVIDLPRLDDAAGDGEIASHPDRVAAFRNGIALAVDHARELGCARVNCRLAAPPAGLPVVLARATLVANLGYAATMLAAAGIRFLIEPAGSAADFEALRAEIGNPNLSLYVDCSHAGDSLRSLERLMPVIGHVRIGGALDLGELDGGWVNARHVCAMLDRLGYGGWVGSSTLNCNLLYKSIC